MNAQTGIKLTNVVLSTNPCPVCVDANGRSMTYQEWIESEWGLPGSVKRYCKGNCHCILIPKGATIGLPALGKKVLLRGDKNSDIRPVIEVGPYEEELKMLMEEWNARIGVLPKKLYTLTIEEATPFLRRELSIKLKELGL